MTFSMQTSRVYPDTNVALHYKPFNEIDWRRLVGCDDVVVLITSVFLREIDQQKDRERGNVQKRAKRVNAWLGEVRRSKKTELARGVQIEVNHSEPETEVDFKDHGLVAAVNDDKLLACMIRDHQKYPDAVLVCVTADNNLAFKAEAKGFTVVEPLDIDRLSEGLDPAEVEIRDLKKKIADLANRAVPLPELGIHFVERQTHLEVPLKLMEPLTDGQRNEYLEREAQRLSTKSTLISALFLEPPRKSEIDRYTKMLGDWLRWYGPDAAARGLTFRMQLLLSNDGPGNAEDIDVCLRFPETVFLAEHRLLPTGPEKPKRPKPRSVMAVLGMDMFAGLDLGRRLYPIHLKNELTRLISQERPHEVALHFRSIKHKSELKLPAFDAWFCPNSQIPSGFAIAYRVHAASTPKIVEGILHVCVTTKHLDLTVEYERIPDEPEELDASD